jgi:spore maturation protein CgeB
MLVTDAKRNLDKLFDVGREVVAYEDTNDLVEKIHFFLSHEEERERIAHAGQQRTLHDHTYLERMSELAVILAGLT